MMKCWFLHVCFAVKSQVPGSVFTDLMRAGIIQDPYYRLNDVTYRHYCYLDWSYHKCFSGWLVSFYFAWIFLCELNEIHTRSF